MRRWRRLPAVAVVVLANLAVLYPVTTVVPNRGTSDVAHGSLNHQAPLVVVGPEEPD